MLLTLRSHSPDSDLRVLVAGEDPPVTEADGLDGTGRGGAGVEHVQVSEGGDVIDIDEVVGGGVEEVAMRGEAGDGVRPAGAEGGE